MRAELILHGGNVLTQDVALPRATAVAIGGGRVLAVGRDDDILALADGDAKVENLHGRTLIPGFNDAHVHVWKVGQLLTSVLDLRGCPSIADLKARLYERASAGEGWVQARGYNEAILAEKRHPTRADLDEVCPDRPVFLIRTCAHIAIANSKALALAGIDRKTTDPHGGMIGRDEAGELNGMLMETALGLVSRHVPQPTRKDLEAMIRAAMEQQLRLGITSCTDPAVSPELMDAYLALDREGTLPGRVNLLYIRRPDGGTLTNDLPAKHLSDYMRLDSIKLFADGGLSGATAALSRSYRHADTRGILRLNEEEIAELAAEPVAHGWRVGIHAIGDDAIEAVLRAYQSLGVGPDFPHRIEHFGLPTEDQRRRAAALGLVSVTQPVFLRELGGNFLKYLPPGMIADCYPYRACLEAGVALAFSTDAPVVKEQNPLAGIRAAVDRRCHSGEIIAPDQSIAAEHALRAYTLGGAIASGDHGNRGSITPGKWADLALLSGDPLTTETEELDEIRAEATWLAGRCVWHA